MTTRARKRAATTAASSARKVPTVRDEIAELRRSIEVLAEMVCPHCGPAAIARLHPDKAPGAQLPKLEDLEPAPVSGNGHGHG